MAGRVCVIGSANVDCIVRVPRLPAPGETVTEGVFTQVFGGKGANSAVAAARAGAAVGLVACLGDEATGRAMRASFEADGIDTGDVAMLAGIPCGTALILVDAAGQNLIAVAPGANDALSPAVVAAAEPRLAASAVLLLQQEIPVAGNRAALALAARHGVRALVNYAPFRGGELELSAAIGGLIVNELEAGALAGGRVDSVGSAIAAAEALRARGPGFVAVTLGADGVVLAAEDGAAHVPGFRVDPVDTTAAGDTFCGALGAALADGDELVAAARFACAAAAISVTRLGAQPSIPSRAEIDALLAKLA